MGLLADLLGLGRSGRKSGDNGSGAKSRYRCASIRRGAAGGCAAVAALLDKRFLPDEIPTLPLADCSAETCDCHFELHEDRRRTPRPEAGTEQPAANDD